MSELDQLLEAAREAQPSPLSSASVDSMVRRAREGSLDRVLEDARRAEPEALTERELRAMTERAAMTGRARHRRWTRHRVMMASALAATAAAAAVTLFVLREPSADRPAPIAQPTDLDLPTGDRLVAASGARFDVALPEPSVRRVRLEDGAMLFDVRHIEGGRFTVSTSRAEVVVLGTVFSVRASEGATTVWVYEGAVQVRGSRSTRTVRAGDVLRIGEGDPGEDPLGRAGEAAAARRRPVIASAPEAVRQPDEGRVVPDDRAPSVSDAPERAASVEPAARAPSRGGGRVEDGRVEDGRVEDGRVEGGRVEDGRVEDGRVEDGRVEDGRVEDGRVEDGRVEEELAGRPLAHEAPPAPAEAPPSSPAHVRGLIASGDAARALVIVRDAIARGELDPWRMLEGDALRVLGRFDEAAAAYARAARELPAPRREQAGFLEARVRMGELSDAEGALRALRSARVTAPGSVLAERGLALEARILLRLERRADAAEIAREYMRRFPSGPEAGAMRALDP